MRSLLDEQRREEAKQAARNLMAEVEKSYGAESWAGAEALDLLVEALYRGGEYREPQTIALAERAVELRERLHGKRHPALARSLDRLALIVYFDVRRDEALTLAERALAVRRRALGSNDPELAESLWLVGTLHDELGESGRALEYLEQALRIRESQQDPDPVALADSLNYLANCLQRLGRYDEALTLHERSQETLQSASGEGADVARSLFNQALIHGHFGDYKRAMQLYEEALRLNLSELGPDHDRVKICHGAIADLLYSIGDYAAARSRYELALADLTEGYGDDQPVVASLLTSLGSLHEDVGNLDDALTCRERALEIQINAHGEDHPAVADSLSRLAALLEQRGKHAEAQEHFSQALEILQSAPDDDPLIAETYERMSVSLRVSGDREKADRLARESLAIFEKLRGPDHPSVVGPLYGLGELQATEGRLVEARESFRRAREVVTAALGAGHPANAEILYRDALALTRLQLEEDALEAALSGAAIARTHLRATARVLPEREALAYARRVQDNLDLALTIVLEDELRSNGADLRVGDAMVRTRALVLDEMAARHRAVSASADSEVDRFRSELSEIREKLSNLLVRGPGELPVEHHRAFVDETRLRLEKTEIALADRSREFRERLVESDVGLDQVRRSLPADSALVAYVLFRRHEPVSTGEADVVEWTSTPAYAAFVLGADRSTTGLVDLGSAAEIDAAVGDWRAEATRGPWLHESNRTTALRAYRETGRKVHRRIWEPVVGFLAGARRVFVVPDGSLNLINFAALPSGADRYLIHTGPTLHLLSTERDLASTPTPARGEGLLALGAPDFDASPAEAAPSAAASPMREYRRAECGALGEYRFDALPATLLEVEELAALWSGTRHGARGTEPEVTRLTGNGATETEFRRAAAGRRVIHLATHGFFLDGDCLEGPQGFRGIGGLSAPGAPAVGAAPSPNPLMLSGLALAGANRRKLATSGMEDGILTPGEIATLDLSGTEWAVLSACDTGVGVVNPGEGVFGMRRAFFVAGAGTVVMSLWEVDDAATRSWMGHLYEARLVDGLDTADAVRAATLSALDEREKAGIDAHPFFWAAFVAAGDWK